MRGALFQVMRSGHAQREPTFSARVAWATGPSVLWELILADNAEAEFVESAVSQLMIPSAVGLPPQSEPNRPRLSAGPPGLRASKRAATGDNLRRCANVILTIWLIAP